MRTELQRLVTDPVKGEELKSRQAVLNGRYARELERYAGLATRNRETRAYDLPLDTLNKYLPRSTP
jgi:hypothetical protein